jgi:ABC-2 type transport system permease protein
MTALWRSFRRSVDIYAGLGAMAAKARLAYNWWVWADFVMTIVSMIVFVYFWRAVYAGTASLGGLALTQTVTYILLARMLAPLIETRMIFSFGYMIRTGQVAVEMTRPVDPQLRISVESLAEAGVFLVQRLPIFLIAWGFFGLVLPADPALWVVFLVSLLLGLGVILLFDWCFACLAFYVTETWGLSVVRIAVAAFFGGTLVPLAMMPDWLQSLAVAMPFAQGLAVPISFLSGMASLADAPRVWLVQLAWIVGLLVASRLIFSVAVRKVTVQGG